MALTRGTVNPRFACLVLRVLLHLRVHVLAIQLRALKMSAQRKFGGKDQLNGTTGVLCL